MVDRIKRGGHTAEHIRLDKAKRQTALQASTTPDSTHRPVALSFLYTDAEYFAKLSLDNESTKLASQQSQYQPVDKIWPANVSVDVGINAINKFDEVDHDSEDTTASEQGDSLTQSDRTAVEDGDVYDTSNSVSCALANTL